MECRVNQNNTSVASIAKEYYVHYIVYIIINELYTNGSVWSLK